MHALLPEGTLINYNQVCFILREHGVVNGFNIKGVTINSPWVGSNLVTNVCELLKTIGSTDDNIYVTFCPCKL